MKSWFDSSEPIDALELAAQSWLGTPFRANAAIKGEHGGVSCHLFVAKVYEECGAVEPRDWPEANPNHSLSQTQSLIEPFVAAMPEFADLTDGEELLPGDLLGFKIGGCTHHIAIVLRDLQMVHAVRHHGVMLNRHDDPMWAKRLTRRWRRTP